VSFHRADISTGKFEVFLATGAVFNPALSLASDDKTVYAPVFNDQDKTGTIMRLDLATGQRTTIYTAPEGGYVTGLALSPDNRSLAIMLFTRSGGRQSQQLAVLNADGTELRRLTEPGVPASLVPVLGLEWSPDSRWVYFVHTKKPDSELWRVPAAGGAAEYTGVMAAGMKHIHLSSDGSRLAFTGGQRMNQELWAMDNLLPAPQESR
jgi:Tol biopolymer transport system component